MSRSFAKGAKVTWAWGAHRAHGEVVERFERRVSRTLKGEKVVRNGSKDEPAYLIRQADGDQALKSHSELSGS
jgi:hypothetical protein